MSNKLVDNKRRSHSEKVLQNMSKKVRPDANSSDEETTTQAADTKKDSTSALRDQYEVIRTDILQLRDDLVKGYDMAKQMVEKKGLVKQILRAK